MMAEYLPLIPEKNAPCTDVRKVLRTVFRELDALPPLSVGSQAPEETQPEVVAHDGDHLLPEADLWVEQCKSESKKISEREKEIKQQHAKRIAGEPLLNIYKLHKPRIKEVPEWRLERGLIDRKDLKPAIDQNVARDESLWVKSILNASSCELSVVKLTAARPVSPVSLSSWKEHSVHSFRYSMGEMFARPSLHTPGTTVSSDDIKYILSVPSRLDFINCTPGSSYAQTVRLINMSKFECRLALTPPKQRVLGVELQGSRGLAISSGSAVVLKVHFTPLDVRALYDAIVVRVSCGQEFTIPIACYMQPPILHFKISAVNFPAFVSIASQEELETGAAHVWSSNEVLELGARLLGDVHCVRVLMTCDSEHVLFFLLTEDAWVNCDVDCLTDRGSVLAGSFVFWPAWWRGGGLVRACAWCRGDRVGSHEAALRVLSSNAINRQLYLLADVLLFKPHHLTLKAHEKDFDICGEDDASCEYYVNLGNAFPNRALSATVQLINSSPVVYNYYWDVRRWGVCLCWEDEHDSGSTHDSSDDETGDVNDTERMCSGALQTKRLIRKDPEAYAEKKKVIHVVNMEPSEGRIMPRTTCTLTVRVPDVGSDLGVQRSVVRLIVKNIPKESIPEDYKSMILNTREELSTPVHGVQRYMREVCEVLCAQMEVWWDVVPLRFALEPSVMILKHSRRLNSIPVQLSACQLFGSDSSYVTWQVPARVAPPPPLSLSAAQVVVTQLTLPLPSLPNDDPETDVLTLVAANDEWQAECVVTRQCETRHPALYPDRAWLGVVPPRTRVRTVFTITNDTYENIYFWCEAHRWWGENRPAAACVGKIPCEKCQQFYCTCALLKPTRGGLIEGESKNLNYNVNAPERDGCVVTLVQARRCNADLARLHHGPGTEARASLVAYRVLAPRVVMRLLPCGDSRDCTGCGLDPGEHERPSGTAMLRPNQALVLGRRTCYRLIITNITPIPTVVNIDKPIDSTDVLKVMFQPNHFNLTSYAEEVVRVVLEPLKVCARRIFVYRVSVARAYKPMYLVIDAAISGLKISCQVPLGGVKQDDFVIMQRTQKEPQKNPLNEGKGTPNELFALEDRKRKNIDAACRCAFKMKYIPPQKRPEPPPKTEDDWLKRLEIVTEPPPFTRVCPCDHSSKPFVPEVPETVSLEFINLPTRKVCERRLVLRNESLITAHWSTTVRRWPRQHKTTLDKDKWASGVHGPGVALECQPPRGVLAALAHVEIYVRVYADSWGLYYDQILIQVEKVEAIVLDVWIEVVAPPLQFRLQPDYNPDAPPVMWMNSTDPTRVLNVKNVSRSELTVQAYLTHENEQVRDTLPFRLYFRFYDVLPAVCPCLTAYDSDGGCEESESVLLANLDMDTGVELYLTDDHGQPDYSYLVKPEECTIKPGEHKEWEVTLMPPLPSEPEAREATLILRTIPVNRSGECWYRTEPPPQLVRCQTVKREPRVKLSCDEISVSVCVMDLAYTGVLRMRRRFCIINVGNGSTDVSMRTSAPWSFIHGHQNREECYGGCKRSVGDEHRNEQIKIHLPPKSSIEICVEVFISRIDVWPEVPDDECAPIPYQSKKRTTTELQVYNNVQLILTLPLIVILEFPVIKLSPRCLDFGFVTDGNTRKSFITVSHTSPTTTLTVKVKWLGCEEFKCWPSQLVIAPGGRENLYVQYTAVWRHGPADGTIVVTACAGAASASPPQRPAAPLNSRVAWCRACAPVRATPTLDHKWSTDIHDYTDDQHLMPERVQHYVPK